MDRSLLVRRERLIQVGLAALRREAPAKAAAEIDRIVGLRLKTALEAKSTDALRRFVECFDGQPAAETARRELIQRLAADKHWLEAEMLLWRDRQSPAAVVAGPAVAQLAQILEQAGSLEGAPAGRLEGAAVCCRQLQAQFADVVCRDGKTGKQLYAAAAASATLGPHLHDEAPWPTGEVEVKKLPRQVMRNDAFGRFSIGCDGDRGPFFAQTVVRFNQNRRHVEGADAYGREQWHVQLNDDGNILGYNNNTTTTHILGHLMVIPFGPRLFAIDPLGLAGGDNRLLWTQDLTDAEADAAMTCAAGMRANVFVNGVVFAGGVNQFQLGWNVVGAVASRYVCFQRMENLAAVDPLTGQTLWVRRNIPPGSWVFGDDEVVGVAPPAFPGPMAAALPLSAAPGKPHAVACRGRRLARLPRGAAGRRPPRRARQRGDGLPCPGGDAGLGHADVWRRSLGLHSGKRHLLWHGGAEDAPPQAGRKRAEGQIRRVPIRSRSGRCGVRRRFPARSCLDVERRNAGRAGAERAIPPFGIGRRPDRRRCFSSRGDASALHVLRSGDQYLLLVLRNRPQRPGVFAQAFPARRGSGRTAGSMRSTARES